jgi:hypothetical protein
MATSFYSAGENGADDGGSNESNSVFEGQSTTDLDADDADKLQQKIPRGADDLPIRVPRPSFKMPAIRPESASSQSK